MSNGQGLCRSPLRHLQLGRLALLPGQALVLELSGDQHRQLLGKPREVPNFLDDISNVAFTQNYGKVQTKVSNYYTWGGSTKGGHYSKITGKFDNCVLRWGCIGSSYPWVEIYSTGNGMWRAFGGT
jgi:hypothetical protein